ncbi:hypothetical protein OPIT5_06580 [Opitutaceae bacterium TAV5]|nr:hypothetical protein OPIT5_06580 [Opitutaceae bacterium TAV5]
MKTPYIHRAAPIVALASVLVSGTTVGRAADFQWTASVGAAYNAGTNWAGNVAPSSTSSDTTDDIVTPSGYGDVLINVNRHVRHFNVALDQDWLWRAGSGTYTYNINGTLTKSGSAALTFRGHTSDNNFTLGLVIGGIDLQGGTLNFGEAIYGAAGRLRSLNVTGATTIAANSTLNLNVRSGTGSGLGTPSATLNTITLNGGTLNIAQMNATSATTPSGSLTTGITAASLAGASGTVQTKTHATPDVIVNGVLTLNAASGSTSYGGLVADGVNATLAIQKTGAAEQILTGSNTYTGGTEVQAGIMATGITGNFGTGNVRVQTATLFLGNAASIADAATLFFTNNSTVDLSFAGTEFIGALTNETTSVSATAGIYTASQLNDIFGGNIFSGDGLLAVAIPEPSAVVLLIALCAAVPACRLRRRRASLRS